MAAYNSSFAKWRVMCFYDSLVPGSSSVFQINFYAENPTLHPKWSDVVRNAFETPATKLAKRFDKQICIKLTDVTGRPSRIKY
ncbi:MAG: hypothetical protein LC116_07360 [Bacteroidetes bacterium]|nr:hypothetical protein [Bacteroidota bacterium]MCZ2132983.1 hypothetical protein [Bacteroidota bacterium]